MTLSFVVGRVLGRYPPALLSLSYLIPKKTKQRHWSTRPTLPFSLARDSKVLVLLARYLKKKMFGRAESSSWWE